MGHPGMKTIKKLLTAVPAISIKILPTDGLKRTLKFSM